MNESTPVQTDTKQPGQIAYERSRVRFPRAIDGTLRPKWTDLPDAARESWKSAEETP